MYPVSTVIFSPHSQVSPVGEISSVDLGIVHFSPKHSNPTGQHIPPQQNPLVQNSWQFSLSDTTTNLMAVEQPGRIVSWFTFI
jgi:hypothetical protein